MQPLKRLKGIKSIPQERGNKWFRFLDRTLGLLGVILFSLRKSRSSFDNRKIPNPQTILCVKLGAIGDTLLMFPVLKAIKTHFPSCCLTLICSRNNYEIARMWPYFDNLILFDVGQAVRNPLYFFRFLKKLRDKRADIVLDFGEWSKIEALVAAVVPSKLSVGFKTDGQYRHYAQDISIVHRDNVHEVENYANLVRSLGIPVNDLNFDLIIQDHIKEKVVNLLSNRGINLNNIVVFHPWATGYKGIFREWPLKNYVKIAKDLRDFSIIITGSKHNAQRAANLASQIGNSAFSVAGKFSLQETTALLKMAKIVITINTGIMHIAAVLGVPMVALHGPTNPIRWGPVGADNSKTIIIKSRASCAPCLSLGFDYKCSTGGCMNMISVDEVREAIEKLLT